MGWFTGTIPGLKSSNLLTLCVVSRYRYLRFWLVVKAGPSEMFPVSRSLPGSRASSLVAKLTQKPQERISYEGVTIVMRVCQMMTSIYPI